MCRRSSIGARSDEPRAWCAGRSVLRDRSLDQRRADALASARACEQCLSHPFLFEHYCRFLRRIGDSGGRCSLDSCLDRGHFRCDEPRSRHETTRAQVGLLNLLANYLGSLAYGYLLNPTLPSGFRVEELELAALPRPVRILPRSRSQSVASSLD